MLRAVARPKELRRMSRLAAELAAARCCNALPPRLATALAAPFGVCWRTVSITGDLVRSLLAFPPSLAPPVLANLPLLSRLIVMMLASDLVQPNARAASSPSMQGVEFAPDQISQRVVHVVISGVLVWITFLRVALQLQAFNHLDA